MFAGNEKNDPRVRFNVGQGMILTIVYVALYIVVGIISALIPRPNYFYGGGCAAYGVITSLLWLSVSAFMVIFALIGIMGVSKNQEKPLPIIGKFAFYK